MINYTDLSTPDTMNPSRCVDVLTDVRDDVCGVAECLRSLSEMARQTVIEPASLSMLANVLALAADAIDSSLAAMRPNVEEKQLRHANSENGANTMKDNTDKKQLMIDLQVATTDTADLLEMLGNIALHHAADVSKDTETQTMLFGLHTAISDRCAALRKLTERF